MGFRVNNNITALSIGKNLRKTDLRLNRSIVRISSGFRINKAADDSSGLTIADSLKANSKGLRQSIINANDGINILQTADGALEESVNIIMKIRNKSIQAASDSQNITSRKALQRDIDKLLEELQMIAETTSYNGQNLLDGTFQDKIFHVGSGKDEVIQFNLGDARASKIGAVSYANTSRINESGSSEPFLRGAVVNSHPLSEGDIVLNQAEIEESCVHYIYYDEGFLTTIDDNSAMAKAQSINDKVNSSGVQAKAQTEVLLGVNGFIGNVKINGISLVSEYMSSEWITNPANNHSYKLTEAGTWYDCENEAVGENAHLVTINDHNEQDWLKMNFNGGKYFLGYNDKDTEGVWTWASGESSAYTNWTAGEPNGGGGENFALMNDFALGEWNDVPGGIIRRGIIEKDQPNINVSATSAELADRINSNEDLQNMGIRAEVVGTDNLIRIIAEDGRNVKIQGDTGLSLNGVQMTESEYTFMGTLTLSDAGSMRNGNMGIESGTISSGDLIINGIDIAEKGPLVIKNHDYNRRLVDAVNENTSLQILGIRTELFSTGTPPQSETRIRLISEEQPLKIGGNNPVSVAGLIPGETNGIRTTGVMTTGKAGGLIVNR